MFVRRTKSRQTDGASYHTHRLVRSERDGGRVRQRTLLNLGRHFDIDRERWPPLCQRVEAALAGQTDLFDDVPADVEREAQRIVAQLVARGAQPSAPGDAQPAGDLQTVAVDSLALVRPRSVGAEHVALWALAQLGLPALLESLGVNAALRDAALGSVVARMAFPASERATHRWLRERSAVGELLGVDFETVGAMQLYRASDALMAHREAIEAHLFDTRPTVTLFDLTNTCLEGDAADPPKARRGHSKEKRSDCPLPTLGLVLDASGFVRRSQVFAGSVREHETLEAMLSALGAPRGALVVMDRGIATEDRVTWLRDSGYRYLVVSRERRRRFDADAAVPHGTRTGRTVHLHKVVSRDPDEVRLYCHSPERADKERGIVERFGKRFEQALTELSDGLSRPRTHKKLGRVRERIGRLKADSRGVARHYVVDVVPDADGVDAAAVTFSRRPLDGSMATHPGVLLPAQQRDRLGRGHPVAHLHHADRPRGRVPLAQVRARAAAHPPPQAGAGRGPPVHHRDRLPGGPDRPQTPGRRRRARQLDHAAQHPRRPAARHRHLPPRRRAHPARAHRHRRGTRPEGDLRRARRRSQPRRHTQNRCLSPYGIRFCDAL